MALLRRFNLIPSLYQSSSLLLVNFICQQKSAYLDHKFPWFSFFSVPQFPIQGGTSCFYKPANNGLPWTCRNMMTHRSTMAAGLLIFLNDKKSLSTQATAQVRKVGAQISIASPGFVYEPYAPREPMPFWKRLV
ncbi:hypothetical protein V6N11_026467 [Hibiscus sabdariffa]|uniref:Uncharacterized protein n=1 Tax=Hibiscus sabdariffa TaxID=183260 RepID=A0ABR2SWL6_9ROSI